MDEADRKATRRTSAILRYRWELQDDLVYHAVEPMPGGHYEPACRRTGRESILEVDHTVRCRECTSIVADRSQ